MPRSPDNSHKLLPSNSTTLERNVARSMPFDTTLAPMPLMLRRAKLVDIPESFIPWLLIEYGLTEFADLFSDPRELLTEGRELNWERGTVAGLLRVLRWLGYPDAALWEEPQPELHFAEYHIDLGRVPDDMHDLCRLAQLVKSVQPMRARLRRVYHGYDVRHFYLDNSEWGDKLSHYSGEWFDSKGFCADTGLWASFAHHYDLSVSAAARPAPSLQYTRVNVYGLWIRAPRWPRLDIDYERGFYPSVGVVGLAAQRTHGPCPVHYRARWQALRYPSARSVTETKVVGISHTTDGFIIPDDAYTVPEGNDYYVLPDSSDYYTYP